MSGPMSPEARAALERAWLGVLRRRYPDRRWFIVGPDERLERDDSPASGQIVGPLASPENDGSLLNGRAATSAENRANHDGVDE